MCVKINVFIEGQTKSLNFSLTHNENKITGTLYMSKDTRNKRVTIVNHFKDVKGFDWYYYADCDKDYIDDKRTDEQKVIEKKILDIVTF